MASRSRFAAEPKRFIGRVPAVIAIATMTLGVVDLVSALTPERAERLHTLTSVVPLTLAHVASAGTAVAGLLLVMLGHGLRRRKRRAWRAAAVLLMLSTVLHIIKGLDFEESTVTLAL